MRTGIAIVVLGLTLQAGFLLASGRPPPPPPPPKAESLHVNEEIVVQGHRPARHVAANAR
ncbi:MAG: hypothetical protein QM704_13760 [Anaeromyxobacteraceae bacterium]